MSETEYLGESTGGAVATLDTAAAISCSSCDGPVSAGAAFCGSCGAPTQHATPEQHRSYWTKPGITARLGGDGLLAAIAVIVGGVAVAVGALLPWMTISAPLIGTASRSGVQLEDAWVLIVLGGAATAAAVAALVGTRLLPSRWSVAVIGAVSGLFLVVARADIHDRLSKLSGVSDVATGTYGTGLWVAAIGAIVLTAGATRLPAGPGSGRKALTACVIGCGLLAAGVAGRQVLARQAVEKMDRISASLETTTTTSFSSTYVVPHYDTTPTYYSPPTTAYVPPTTAAPTTTTTVACPAKPVAKVTFSATPDDVLGAGYWNISVSGTVSSRSADLDLSDVMVHYRTTSKEIDGTTKTADEIEPASSSGMVHKGRSASVSATSYAVSIAKPVMTSVEVYGSWADSGLYACAVS